MIEPNKFQLILKSYRKIENNLYSVDYHTPIKHQPIRKNILFFKLKSNLDNSLMISKNYKNFIPKNSIEKILKENKNKTIRTINRYNTENSKEKILNTTKDKNNRLLFTDIKKNYNKYLNYSLDNKIDIKNKKKKEIINKDNFKKYSEIFIEPIEKKLFNDNKIVLVNEHKLKINKQINLIKKFFVLKKNKRLYNDNNIII